MKRRILATILCMAILLTVFMSAPITASADDGFFVDGVKYRDIDDTSVEIVGCNSSVSKNLVIPATVQGKNVVRIGRDAFYQKLLWRLVLPDTLTEISDYAFIECRDLEEITFSQNLKYIGASAFYGCRKIKAFNLPDTVETIGDKAFSGCSFATQLKLPKNLTSLGKSAFSGCTKIKTVTVNSKLEVIGDGAFSGNLFLTDVIFEERTTPINLGAYALSSCSNLRRIDLSLIDTFGEGALAGCSALTSVDLSKEENITLGDAVFSNCIGLKTVKLPDYITTIPAGCFSGCTSLERIETAKLISIGDEGFENCSNLKDMGFLQDNVLTYIGDNAFSGCDYLTEIHLPYIEKLGSSFQDCANLSKITFGEKLTKLSQNTFKNCTSLTEISIPNIKVINRATFNNCTSLTEIYMPDVEEVGGEAFQNCINLSKITISDKLMSIGSRAFQNCYYLTEFYLPNIEIIYDEAFSNCYSLSKVTLGDKLKEIRSRAFQDCYSLTEITLPNIETVYDETFKNCISLSKVTLREGLKLICDGAFFNCFSLEELYIPTTVEIIGEMAIACFEEEGEYYVYTDFTVIGLADSLADEYAEAYGIKYKRGLTEPKLTSISNTDSGVKISFEKIAGVNGYYRVYRKTADTSWKSIADVSSASYTDTTATAGTVYTYTVKFIGYDGIESTYDKDGLTITRMKTPSVTKIENTVDGAKISWNTVAGATKYRAYVKTSDGWKSIGDTSSTSIVHTDVVSGTSYTYTIKAYDSNGAVSGYNYTGWSNKFIATPFIKNAEVTNSGVKLSWDKVAGAENYSYRIFIKNGSSWKTIATVSGNTNTYTDKTVSAGNTYTYTIRCVDSNNKYVSGYDSKGYTIRMLETPTGVSFENIDSGVVISFLEVQGAQSYRIYVKNGESFSKLGDINSTSYIHESAVDGETYTYTVRCISENKVFESGYNSTGFTHTYIKPEIKFALGDVDADFEISVLDATAIQLHAARLDILTEDELSRADTDRDNEVSVMDATKIQLFLARIIDMI